MPLETKLKILKRKSCESFNNGYCRFYQTDCFHDDSNHNSITSRCYRLISRKEEEFMDWMSDICSDCNEPVCNDCDIYIDYISENNL